MIVITQKTQGVPGDCALQGFSEFGAFRTCEATDSICKIDGGKCPFDQDEVIQISYKKTKEETSEKIVDAYSRK